MCNYCQTSTISSNFCGYTPRWRVQRICYDCQGDIHVIVTNGCVYRRLICGVGQGNLWTNEVNVPQTIGNGCFGGCANNTATTNNNGCFGGCANQTVTTNGGGCFGRCASNVTAIGTATVQDADSYYARLYGTGFGTNGRSCCCGGHTAL